MKFIKMEGIGNDYVYIDCFKNTVKDPSKVAKIVSDRHFGIGSDGLILICPSDTCDVKMLMYNMDGSQGEMCGNGSRCVAKYIYDHGYAHKPNITMETVCGVKYIDIEDKDGKADMMTVDMGEPHLTSELPEHICIELPSGKISTEFIGVDVGNPHAVYYVSSIEELNGLNLESIGPSYEHHKRFPQFVNSEFIYVKDRTHLYMRVWERGSGETLACGTGATASAYATIISGLCDNEVKITLKGGELSIRFDEATKHLYMTGPAREVFTGDIYIEGED